MSDQPATVPIQEALEWRGRYEAEKAKLAALHVAIRALADEWLLSSQTLSAPRGGSYHEIAEAIRALPRYSVNELDGMLNRMPDPRGSWVPWYSLSRILDDLERRKT